ncbi:MAG: flagellar hook-associated protein FlgK [Candidatus Kryptonium sp.]|nr:flagellar hook-associated protein FlgK [Candidatus Kryptonium sp.]MDW8108317.1 flagellar hook-associated protein FlgK [Candidatus Kryptonium sp.]
MAGLFGIIETAKKAIHSSRTGMEVTSHNVSNVNTPGYTRQRVNLTSTDALSSNSGMINAGVKITGIKQIRNEFIEGEIRRVSNLLSSYSAEKEILTRIESLLNEPSDVGLGQLLENFFNAFDDLSKNPEDRSIRVSVAQTGRALAQRFNDIFYGLLGIKKDIIADLEAKIKNINQIIEDLGKLNQSAINQHNSGFETNDVRDKINQKLKELSNLADIVVSYDESGSVRVSIGGVAVVERNFVQAIDLKFSDGVVKIVSTQTESELRLNSGEVFVLQNMFNRQVPEIIQRFDELAKNLSKKVNEIHKVGYSIDGTTGLDFFVGTSIGSIQVNKIIIDNPLKISASINKDAGNNQVALAISALRNDGQISGVYNSIVSDIGLKAKISSDNENLHRMILKQLETQRDAFSGVSIDEEMLNMIKFQKMFEASAKVIQTVNEMIDTILSMVR